MDEADALIERMDHDEEVVCEFIELIPQHSLAQLRYVRQALIARAEELATATPSRNCARAI